MPIRATSRQGDEAQIEGLKRLLRRPKEASSRVR